MHSLFGDWRLALALILSLRPQPLSASLPKGALGHELAAVAAQLAPKIVLLRSHEAAGASAVRTPVHPEFEMYLTALHNVRSCSPQPRYGRIAFTHCPSLKVFVLGNGALHEDSGDFLVSSVLNNDLAAIVRLDHHDVRPLRAKIEAHLSAALLPPGSKPQGRLYCAAIAMAEGATDGIANRAGQPQLERDFAAVTAQWRRDAQQITALMPAARQGYSFLGQELFSNSLVTRGAFLNARQYRVLAMVDEQELQPDILSANERFYTPIDSDVWLVVSRVSSLRQHGRYLETDCAAETGSSGGGVFQPDGAVVGIASGGATFQDPWQQPAKKQTLQHTALTRERAWVPLSLGSGFLRP